MKYIRIVDTAERYARQFTHNELRAVLKMPTHWITRLRSGLVDSKKIDVIVNLHEKLKPGSIQVGELLAELPEYQLFTQADAPESTIHKSLCQMAQEMDLDELIEISGQSANYCRRLRYCESACKRLGMFEEFFLRMTGKSLLV